MHPFPLAPLKRLLQKSGAKKSTKEATIVLGDILAEITIHITERAALLAQHAKRRTINRDDISLAKYEIWG